MTPFCPVRICKPVPYGAACAVLLLLFWIGSSSAFAADVFNPEKTIKQLDQFNNVLDNVEANLTVDAPTDQELLTERKKLQGIRDQLLSIQNENIPLYDAAKADITNLGPAPEGDNATPEPDNIQALRKEFSQKEQQLDGLIKQAESLAFRSNRLLKQITTTRRDQFVGQLVQKQASPLNGDLWLNTLNAYHSQLSSLVNQQTDHHESIWPTQITAGVLYLFLLAATTFISARKLNKQLTDSEGSSETVLSTIAQSLTLPMVVSTVCLLLVFQMLHTQGLLSNDSQTFIIKCLGLTLLVTFMFLVSQRLARAEIFRPSMRWMGFAAALLYALDAAFLESGRMMGAPVDLAVGQSYLVTTLFAFLLAAYTYKALRLSSADKDYFFPRKICYLTGFLSAFILLANAFGYPALSRFLLARIVLLFTLFLAVMMLRYLVRPWLNRLDQMLQDNKPAEEGAEPPPRLMFFWLSLTVDITLFLLALPLIAGIIGADWNDIRDWAMQAFLGFKIGSITISVSSIVLAIGFFILALFITRLLQRVLGQKILPRTTMDESLRHSIVQVLGYVGLILALMVAISALGFDLTNLALIAGALSVGIGFGLQSIVSNFVSGLILLFERPIKVGDWIITNSGEGFVKRISVRSTEIETFDRTSIIVPNSELITSSVKNWTHKDRIGRVAIPVGVSYNDDPHQVSDLLMECIKSSSDSLKNPPPSVVFKDFGDSALIFECRFFIRNITDLPRVATKMRLDIWDTLKAAGVEISYPQRDLHIRTAPGLKGLLHEPAVE